MCIAVYKPANAEFPTKRTLKRCFAENPDGAGFMLAHHGVVSIYKGFMGFRSFWKALQGARAKYGDELAYVMHFRISTQAGVTQDCTHPFPLSPKMDDLRRLRCDCSIGIAHNGIISLTSNGYNKTITYSDTMKFITDYLTLIIKDDSFHDDQDKLKLIYKLVESRLAILSADGRCSLIGDWIEDDGIFYSNYGYLAPSAHKSKVFNYNWDAYEWKTDDGHLYDFNVADCDGYCYGCKGYALCYGVEEAYDYK